jgi:hypothetical protein
LSFRKGLCSFLGVPSRVSNDFLSLLFPGFSFEFFIIRRKWGFLRRSLNPSDTLAAIFFLGDRADDFPVGRGFSHELSVLLREFGLPELINCEDKTVVSRALEEESGKETILCWERMRSAKSTSFMCSVFSSPATFYRAALVASSINLSALRIFILMWSGSVSIHLFGSHERTCRWCSSQLDTRHYFGCSFDTCLYLQLIVLARASDALEIVRVTIQSYFSFLWRAKPTIISDEEASLIDLVEFPDSLARMAS